MTGQEALVHWIAEIEQRHRQLHIDRDAARGATIERELCLLKQERSRRRWRPALVHGLGRCLIRAGEGLCNRSETPASFCRCTTPGRRLA